MDRQIKTSNASSRWAARHLHCLMLAFGAAVGCSAPSAPASASPLGDAIANFAAARMGKCIDHAFQTRNGPCSALPQGQTGDGECTHLVQAALLYEKAEPPTFLNYSLPPKLMVWKYKWGTPVSPPYQPGDIIQFWYFNYSDPHGGHWTMAAGHTAIITRALGPSISVLEQNVGIRAVTSRTLDLFWPHTGFYFVYRPQYAGPAYSGPQDAPIARMNPATTGVFRR